jgi:hypothetical protein
MAGAVLVLDGGGRGGRERERVRMARCGRVVVHEHANAKDDVVHEHANAKDAQRISNYPHMHACVCVSSKIQSAAGNCYQAP